MSLVVLGDAHLSDSRPWSWQVSNKIVDSIINHPLNDEANTAIFLGDVTEDAFLSGQVFDLMVKLFSSLRFEHTYILVGNHDLKKNKQGQLTLSFQFLKRKMFKDKISIIELPHIILNVEGMNILALPWLSPNQHEDWKSVKDYENLPKSFDLKNDKRYDLLVGHFQDTSISIPGETVDISKIKTDHICLGHIHDKDHPRYIGSIVPNSVEGAGLPRYLRTYETFDLAPKAVETKVVIPHIMDYCFVTFPDPLPKVDVEIPVWTIYNCKDETTAKAHYGDIYIRRAVYDISMDKEAINKIGKTMANKITNKASLSEMFSEWKKGTTYDPVIIQLAEKYFELTK